MQKSMTTIAAAVAFFTGVAYAADYTWMASPADAIWNGTSLNWNSGAAWADDASAPNNAIFPYSSSKKAIAIPPGETRSVKNMTVGGADYSFSGGDIGLTGTLLVTNVGCTISSRIAATKASGLDYSTSTRVSFRANSGTINPGAGVTNIVGGMTVAGKLTISSGVTRLGVASNATGESAMLYVVGNWNNYNTSSIGILDVTGGTLYATQNFYVDTRQYAQVTVKNGGKVYMPSAEWLNGLYNPSRLTISDGGEFLVGTLRVCSSSASQVNLNEGGLMALNNMAIYVTNTKQAKFLFNGGRIQSRDGRENFLAPSSSSATEEQWNAAVKFAVGEGGAVFDTTNGKNIKWSRPLLSDAAHDGGIRVIGDEILVFTHTNGYNGVTRVDSGAIQLRVDNALPPGSTVRLGKADAYIDGWTFTSPGRQTVQWMHRLEGNGYLSACENMHVTNSVAPAANGSLVFKQVCDLRGDYEISADANGCGFLDVRGANQPISGLTLKVADISAFDGEAARTAYKILDAPNGYTGTFAAGNLADPWYVKYTPTAAYIVCRKGMTISVR